MTPVTCFNGKTVALFGLGGSGIVTALALMAGGAHVEAWDDSAASRQTAEQQGVVLVDLSARDFSIYAALVLSPGVPLTHPKPHWSVEKAKAAAVDVVGDIELFCREREALAPLAPFIAITGTNGKSTTTALIAHLLRESGRDVALGGNIGTAILALEPPAINRFHVIECSSYQIDLAPSLKPTIGVLLNLTEDHLDRHGTMAHYASVKERLVQAADTAIIGIDDAWCDAIAERCEANGKNIIRVALHGPLKTGINRRDREIFWTCLGEERPIADLTGITSLRGLHNAQNAAAAIAAVSVLGLTKAEIKAGLSTFPGLAHRLETIGYVDNVALINDSKATNADATEKALASFDSGLFWIIGGRAKSGGIVALEPYFERVEKAYLIGEAAPLFAATLERRVPYTMSGTLDQAVEDAMADARMSTHPEPAIVLSPACASFDQYKNFEVRGQHFRSLVEALPGFTSARKG
jgi:UDP-N-acetylmuramoylalanine--D-glutamate ligase